ncbi:TetR/AcrR family transcriptional regulator [Kribbella flavida]|uniref:TetR/AcrR family transcriptional regulator n=1 Tax=Kribbella flavida TaxID=182640 RepID=UPI00059E9E2F|nr:TetR/AcrR family transcriptional regulator [Kribbella flavida]
METVERLIRSTQELLWERGYVGTSPKAIQAAAEAGQGSMYHHFAGKAELARAAIERSGAELTEAAEQELAGPGTATERIVRYLRRDREVLRGCRMGRLTADPDVMADPALRAPVAEAFGRIRARLADIIAEGKRDGEFPAGLDPVATAAAVAAVLQGGYVLARAAGEDDPFELAVQGLVHLLEGVSA